MLASRRPAGRRDHAEQPRSRGICLPISPPIFKIKKIHIVTFDGKRTDPFGHSYFTTNPEVSSDVIQLLRYGKRLGDPGREPIRTGPVTWEFPAIPIFSGLHHDYQYAA